MSKLLTLIIILYTITSCQKKEQNFSDTMLEKLNIDTNEIPSQYGIDLYLKTDDNRIFLTNNNYLFTMYQKHYKKEFPTFKAFLTEILNNDYIINTPEIKNFIYDSSKLNSKINEEYAELGFEALFKKYASEISSGNIRLNKSLISEDEYLTVGYLFYINNFDISRDDYIGIDYVVRREKTFE
ncbi:hypothetical protein [Flavobacterium tegetincola]|uniref:hypothetical protein n=1 Tax=Flavobacterium tegetincola TaxID=150172 RepID=UPI000404BFDA|nr:hypothetical protein [Flavobacterium tegetincola]